MRIGCVVDLLAHDSAVTRERATPGRGRRVKSKDEHQLDDNLKAFGSGLSALGYGRQA